MTHDTHLGLRRAVKDSGEARWPAGGTPFTAPAQWIQVPNPFRALCGSATLPTRRKDTIICRSDGDFCLSFSSFSSCLISLFWTRLHFLISAYIEKRGSFPRDPKGPVLTPEHLEVHPAHPGLLYLGTIELQRADDLGLQPLNLQGSIRKQRRQFYDQSLAPPGDMYRAYTWNSKGLALRSRALPCACSH